MFAHHHGNFLQGYCNPNYQSVNFVSPVAAYQVKGWGPGVGLGTKQYVGWARSCLIAEGGWGPGRVLLKGGWGPGRVRF